MSSDRSPAPRLGPVLRRESRWQRGPVLQRGGQEISPVDFFYIPNSKVCVRAFQGASPSVPVVPGHLTPASPSEQDTLHKQQQLFSLPGILFTPAACQHPVPPGRSQPPRTCWAPHLDTGKGSLPSSTLVLAGEAAKRARSREVT